MNLHVSLSTIKILMELRASKKKQIFCDVFYDLKPTAQAALVALMWKGRDPNSNEYFNLLESQATDLLNGQTPEYVYSKSPLVKYWSQGLETLGISPEDT